jgi:hypothetical protein
MEEKKPKIKIKPENKGKFSEYCKRKGYNSVTRECEEEGLASKLSSVRKMSQFSKNSREWD